MKKKKPKKKNKTVNGDIWVAVPKVSDGLDGGTTIPRAPAVPANTNPTHSTKQSPTILCFKQDSERRGRGEGGGAAERA